MAAYQGKPVTFDEDGWFNATVVAQRFGKRPVDWLKLPETRRYVNALSSKSKVKKSHFARTARGGAPGTAGTWLHPKLAVRFAQWLDVDFAIWCDEQIENILHGRDNHSTLLTRLSHSYLEQRLAVERDDAKSQALASVGGKLMAARRHAVKGIKAERTRLDSAMQLTLLQLEEQAS